MTTYEAEKDPNSNLVRFKAKTGRIKLQVKYYFPKAPKIEDPVMQSTILFAAEYMSAEDSNHAKVTRPRNQFIIARIILSKLVILEGSDTMNNDEVSKVVSMVSNFPRNLPLVTTNFPTQIWNKNLPSFKNYFKYLSAIEETWHEQCFPSYNYRPKIIQKPEKYNLGQLHGSQTISTLSVSTPFRDQEMTLTDKSNPFPLLDHSIKEHISYLRYCSSSYPRNMPNACESKPLRSKAIVNNSVNTFKVEDELKKRRRTNGNISTRSSSPRVSKNFKFESQFPLKSRLSAALKVYDPYFYEEKIQNITIHDLTSSQKYNMFR